MRDSFKGLHFGTDYYPEHWPRERWETDASLMKEMGIQVVRLGEFSWHKMEPREGKYDFGWLDEAIALLGRYDIQVILGTPTAAPPAWLVNRHPEILPIDSQGRRRGFGGRHHDCPSNPLYRKYVKNLVTAMAVHFSENPIVKGWQIDNEFGNAHGDLCMCDSCRKSFQEWLQKKYGSVECLNAAWGTAFWSQEYNSFEEVFTPRITVTGENPSAMLDWKCFCSDLIVDFQQIQIDIIRRYCPEHFITHNCMGFADKVNYYDLSKTLDFASHDQYPGGFYGKMPFENNELMAANLDMTRSFKKQPFWIMEQQAGMTGWNIMGRTPAPGQLSAWAEQCVAHGADCVVFFRWRSCTVGTEQYWHGILPHSGRPGRRYAELKEMTKRLSPIMDELSGSMPDSRVGIVFSYRQEYAFSIQPHHPDLNYVNQVLMYYGELYKRSIPVDFVQDTDDFSNYCLVIAPLQYLMTKELADKYFAYAEAGGTLVLTMRTGVKDEHNICMCDRELPGVLSDLCGIEVSDYDCLRDADVRVTWEEERESGVYYATKWSDIITLKGAEALACYRDEFYAGTPCVTENAYGMGRVFYIGTEPSEKLLEAVMDRAAVSAGIRSIGRKDPGVELSRRKKDGKVWIFALNLTGRPAGYEIGEQQKWKLALGGQKGMLQPFELHIYQGEEGE